MKMSVPARSINCHSTNFQLKRKKVNGCVTSLQFHSNQTIYIATDLCEIYTLELQTFILKLQITCNSSIVNDIVFPRWVEMRVQQKQQHLFDSRDFLIRHGSNFSAVFATASYQSVRVWSLTKKQELLRIIVPNFTATAALFAYDGRSILTAWDDGVIRAFTPLTGKLMYAIPNAHNKGYTCRRRSYAMDIGQFLLILNKIFRLFSIGHIQLRQFTRIGWKWRSNSRLAHRFGTAKSNYNFERTHSARCFITIQLFRSRNCVIVKWWHVHHLGHNVSTDFCLNNFGLQKCRCFHLFFSSILFHSVAWPESMFWQPIPNSRALNSFRRLFKYLQRAPIAKLAIGRCLMVA